MKKLIFFILPVLIQAQNAQLGGWKDYLSYNSASFVAESDNKMFCVASGGVFFYNKDDQSLNRLSKVNGLSDVGAKLIGHSENLSTTIIVYENCNIDILKNNETTNISDIKRKEILGSKQINNITIKNNIAYLSASFGLILVDLEKKEVKDTYNIGNGSALFEITGCTFLEDTIFVSTSNGVYFAKEDNPNLSDFTQWMRYRNLNSKYDNITTYNQEIVIDSSDEIVSFYAKNNALIVSYENKVSIYRPDYYAEIIDTNFKKIKYASIDNDSVIWVADSISGMMKFIDLNYIETFIPSGPVRNEIYSLEYENNTLYQCHGGHSNFGVNSLINNGVSFKNNYDEWGNYDRYKLGNARDILEVAVKNKTEYYASWYHGITEMKNGVLITKYGFENTNGALDTCYYSNNRIRISDIKFDSQGNMWALSSEVNHPLVVKTNNGDWYSYTMNQNQVGLFFDDLLIDGYNQKWGIIARGGGVFVYTNNGTIEDVSDDEYRFLNTYTGSGNLPSLQTYSLAEDLDGEIWLGTDKGVAVFYNPSKIFTSEESDAQQILISDGEYGQYLLSEEKIKCIAIDGANRKWIGTEKSGVFLLSHDGVDQILHFTEENSPLYSNNIVDITINQENGEVFFGTSRGLISYRSDATQGEIKQGSARVFPNPVRENYNGLIAISGLIKDANVKITDIYGNLMFETTANGGQATWSGKNQKEKRVATGIYLVFSTDDSGQEKVVSKILFIR